MAKSQMAKSQMAKKVMLLIGPTSELDQKTHNLTTDPFALQESVRASVKLCAALQIQPVAQ